MLAYRSLLSKSLERDTNPSYRRRRSSVCAAFFNQIGGNDMDETCVCCGEIIVVISW